MTKENGFGPNGTESPGWGKRVDQRPTFHYLAEDDEEEHRRGRLGSGGERTAEEHVSRNIHRGNGEIQDWERSSKDLEGNTSIVMDLKS